MSFSDTNFDKNIYHIGSVTVDRNFHTQNADEAFFRFFGNDVIYSIKRTIDEKDIALLEESMEKALSGMGSSIVIRMKCKDNDTRWVLTDVKLLSNNCKEKMFHLSFTDILSLEAFAYSHEKYKAEYRYILSLVSDLAFEYSFETNTIRIYMFDCCRDITLISENIDKWQKNNVDCEYIPARYLEIFNKLCEDIKNGTYRFEYEFESSMLTGGKIRELYLFRGITRYDDPEHRKVTGIISVVSSKQKSKDINLALESNRDSLSELLNKRAITGYAQEILKCKPEYNVNFVLIDIDDFTQINNSYGHLFGDEVIYTIANIIKHELGNRGIAGRISGGGFLLVLENTRDETDLRSILRAVRTKTEWAFADRFDNFRLSCSMGISTYPIDSTNYDELFMQADKALYIAKEKGKNRYVIYDINKHGPVEKDMENKIAFLSSKKDSSEKLEFICNLTDMLVSGQTPDMLVLLEQIRSVFGIDDVCVYAGNSMDLILSCGTSSAKNAAYIFENNYTERFTGDGIFVIDNVNELEGRDDNALEILVSQNVGGAVQYIITENGLLKGLISFCYIGRFKKWPVSDADYLTIIAHTISALLKKQLFI